MTKWRIVSIVENKSRLQALKVHLFQTDWIYEGTVIRMQNVFLEESWIFWENRLWFQSRSLGWTRKQNLEQVKLPQIDFIYFKLGGNCNAKCLRWRIVNILTENMLILRSKWGWIIRNWFSNSEVGFMLNFYEMLSSKPKFRR